MGWAASMMGGSTGGSAAGSAAGSAIGETAGQAAASNGADTAMHYLGKAQSMGGNNQAPGLEAFSVQPMNGPNQYRPYSSRRG